MKNVFVFSGNGMSQRVADALAAELGGFETLGGDSLGLVFPVYGWHPPKILLRFIRDELPAYLAGRRPAFVWAAMTCGDDVGFTDTVLARALRRSLGVGLDAAYSFLMPDTYVALPGFRLDAPKEAEDKIRRSLARAGDVARRLEARERVRDVTRGAFPHVKTGLLGRFFDRFLLNDRFFKVDAERCTRCGRCAANCPARTIRLAEGGTPTWRHDGSCTGCLRCYHNCAADALEFGPFTKGKGRLLSGAGKGII